MGKQIRILYVLNALGGGASLGTYEMLRGLPRDRFAPYAVAPPGSTAQLERMRPLFEDVRLCPVASWNIEPRLGALRRIAIELGKRRRNISFDKRRAIQKAIRDWKIDIVHTGTSLNLGGALAAKEAGVPHVWHIKECIGQAGRVQFPMPDEELARYISGMSAQVIAMSEYIARFFRAHDCRNVEILPDGVNLQPYMNGSSRELRRKLNIGEDQFLVGMVASLASTWKQHEVFIEMAGLLAARHPEVHFLLIGPKPTATRWPHDLAHRYYKRLVRLAFECVRDGRLSFLDFIPDTPDLMRSLDVLVHTCSVEPFGRIAIEAMAAGTPIVGPFTGGIAETVVDGETGLLVRPRDARAFADATSCLFQDARLRNRLGEAGRLRSQERYTLALHVDRQIAIYDHVMGIRERATQLSLDPWLASAAV